MNKQEFYLIAAALKTYYPREKALLPNDQAMSLWFEQLKDIDYKIAEAALNLWVATEKFSPSITELREKAAEISGSCIEDWSKGWEQVIKAIRYCGMYQEDKALESMDEITREVVERIGFINICLSENITADRANFRDIYKTLQERKKKSQNLSISMQKTAEKLKLEANNAKNAQ